MSFASCTQVFVSLMMFLFCETCYLCVGRAGCYKRGSAAVVVVREGACLRCNWLANIFWVRLATITSELERDLKAVWHPLLEKKVSSNLVKE